jgi:LacI family transcriptional regulator, repressor for deo operon, udp, cdd, tsx, nupC, and nupG
MTSIRKVAKKAGVSIGTVSRVLNNKSGVSAKTREYVRAVALELGYALPKRIATGQISVTHIGVLTHPMMKCLPADPFYGEIFHGIEEACQENHISVSYSKIELFNGQLRTLPAMFNDDRINGIIILGGLPFELAQALDNASGQPLILVDNIFPNCPWDAVLIDNPAGSYAAVQHLIEHGHQHIAMIAGSEHPSILERISGYKQAIQKSNLVSNIIKTSALSPESGETGIAEILKQAPNTTAIFCSNDLQAIGASAKLQSLGYSVPGDFSIIGFDNINTGEYTSPPLSTIHVDRPTMGKQATQLLLDRIQNPDRTIIKSVVGTKLIQRKSVAPPK